MAAQPYAQEYTPPSVTGASAYAPARRLLFASKISDSVGSRTLSRAEIDQAIRQHGTNIAVMVDVGGTMQMRAEAANITRYLHERGVKHIGIYTEGRTGPTGKQYEGGELARKEAAKRKYGMTESQWMNGGWEKSFHDQVRHYAKNHGGTFFEADNIPAGQAIKFLKQFQAAKDRGELPPHVQMLLKNPVQSEINELRTALANGSVKRQSIADFAISEEDYKSSWPSLRKGLGEFGIQLGYSHNTNEYACKETYDPSLLGALGRLVKGVVSGVATVVGGIAQGIGAVVGGIANGIGTLLGINQPQSPAPNHNYHAGQSTQPEYSTHGWQRYMPATASHASHPQPAAIYRAPYVMPHGVNSQAPAPSWCDYLPKEEPKSAPQPAQQRRPA